jgi:hypothetical protein
MSWRNNNGRDRTATGGIVWHPAEVPDKETGQILKPGLIAIGDISFNGGDPDTDYLPYIAEDSSCCQRGIVFNEASFRVTNNVGGLGEQYGYIDSIDSCYNYSATGLKAGYQYMVATDPIPHGDPSLVRDFQVCDDVSGPWVRLNIDTSQVEINARRIDISGNLDISGNFDVSNADSTTTFRVGGLTNAATGFALRYDIGTGLVTYSVGGFEPSGIDLDCSNIVDVSTIGFCKDIFLTQPANNSIAIGHQAGGVTGVGDQGTQDIRSIAIGQQAGNSSQQTQAIAIGFEAGNSSQGQGSVAIGFHAGYFRQDGSAVAIGPYAGNTDQSYNSIAIGPYAGYSNQSTNAVAIGRYAGQTDQSTNAVAIGKEAGKNYQGHSAIAIGDFAGHTNQDDFAISFGIFAGQVDQSINSIAIGNRAGQYRQDTSAVAIGPYAGNTDQSHNAVAIGAFAGHLRQDSSSVAIGPFAGYQDQSSNSVAIGNYAGYLDQSSNAIAIGYNAGEQSQSNSSVAIGRNAGRVDQKRYSVAIGYGAGADEQNWASVAIGRAAGNSAQGSYSVAVGHDAGKSTQGDNCVAIGAFAGPTDQHDHTIVINASGTPLDTVGTNRCYMDPMRSNVPGDNAEVMWRSNKFEVQTARADSLAYWLMATGGATRIKSFIIDHPIREDYKLIHSCIEGPQIDLIYRGKIKLKDGYGEINIDEKNGMTNGTFEALCRDIQSFTTNETGWEPVRSKVVGNILHIQCKDKESEDTISWMIIGERKDKGLIRDKKTDDEGKLITEQPNIVAGEWRSNC